MRLSSFLVVVAATLTVSFSNVTYAKEEVKITQLDYAVQEKQAAKLTENIAQEVAKDPSKWSRGKKALETRYGVGLTALIGTGLISMDP
ncbi:hypothetical protein L917_09095 [Phytophthora nicotianae]|uniref:RxLR effector protein n=1 Tax=Phytophthora nicotianae TaxID=4792 RepID=W2L5G8_PHYNI|nr:hypothetical protein L917_09095 [Phytophthora nicotianae]